MGSVLFSVTVLDEDVGDRHELLVDESAPFLKLMRQQNQASRFDALVVDSSFFDFETRTHFSLRLRAMDETELVYVQDVQIE
ncbi:hypothetical protein RZS08_29105, partial [Arthrospira platensis SPKY1]|nr:hypothetical protein [Arthrospira platensis SPKY1]